MTTVRKIYKVQKRAGGQRGLGKGARSAFKARQYNPSVMYKSPNTETRSVDIVLTTQAVNQTGTFQLLNGVATGNSFFNRVGRKIQMKSIRIAGTFTLTGNDTTDIDYGRIIIIYDRQTNGSLPALIDVLQDVTSAGATSNTSLSGLNLNNRDRFTVIRDVRVSLPVVTVAEVSTVSIVSSKEINVDLYAKIGLETQYGLDTGVIGAINTGSLFILTVGRFAAGSDAWRFTYTSRLRYNDM